VTDEKICPAKQDPKAGLGLGMRSLGTNLPARVEFLTFDCIRKPTNLHAIEVSPMPSKELWTDVAIVMIGFVPVLTAVWVIFCF